MWNAKKSIVLSLVVCGLAALIITAGVACMPWFVKFYFVVIRNTPLSQKVYTAVLVCFYTSAVFAYIALMELSRLLIRIYRGTPFMKENVLALRIISWCCFLVAIIAFVGGFFYTPIFFVTIAAGFVGLMLRIVKNVMQTAVEMREEQDLTI